MRTRAVYLETTLALNDSGTKKVDINVATPVSKIELIFGGTKGSTENQSDKIQDHISKIELIDGADVLWSLPMVEAVALNCFETGKRPACDLDLGAGGTPQETCFINFGLNDMDPVHYLDPTMFRNLQLKISTNLTAAAGTYVTNTLTVSVILHIIEEGQGSYDGFLSSKQHYSWTTAASGDETIDMPLDFPYRFIIVKALETNVTPQTDINNLKLTCDADRFIVFDIPTDDMVLRNLTEFGMFEEVLKTNAQDADTILSTIFNIQDADIFGGTVLYDYRVSALTAEQVTIGAFGQTGA